MNFGDANLRLDHLTIYEENEEEDTSIFNMGMPLDAAGTDAIFDFGASKGISSAAGSTFTTHQQQQEEQDLVEKRMSEMQISSIPARSQRTTRDTSDMVGIAFGAQQCEVMQVTYRLAHTQPCKLCMK